MADAETGIGLYNYYVDTLSTSSKCFDFLWGFPAEAKKDGDAASWKTRWKMASSPPWKRDFISRRVCAPTIANIERAAEFLEPLVDSYPQNPVFAMMLGNMDALLNRKERAAANYRAAATMKIRDVRDSQNVRNAAQEWPCCTELTSENQP